MIEKVAKYYNLSLEDTIAFGDGDNDRMFLKKAGVGVAMGNGCESSKLSADFVTTESYNNGIYNGVKQLGYVK